MVQNAYDYQELEQTEPSKLIMISNEKMPYAEKVKLLTEGNF